jgi:alpha-tubulin suppressor-like RCC1 family protein
VAAGWGHSCILTEEGLLYVCGRNVEGQLGLSTTHLLPVNERGHRYQPNFVHVQHSSLYKKMVRTIACGGEHTMLVSDAFDVQGMGLSNRGQLGTSISPPAPQYTEPHRLEYFQQQMRQVLQVSCGYHCSLFLLGSKEVCSLRKLCSDTLRSHQVLCGILRHQQQQQQDGDEVVEMDLSQDYVDNVRTMLV